MAESRYHSTEETAQLLGVSVTTVKRWVDEGLLPAHRTAGGHRKILRAELAELIQAGRLPCANDILPSGSTLPATGKDLDQAAERLRVALLADDSPTVRSLLHGLRAGGVAMAALADRVIGPAMAQIGRDWQAGHIDVYHEHRSTQQVLTVLQSLRVDLERSQTRAQPQPQPRDTPLALGGCPEGDHYLLATLLAELALLEAGWRVVQLGPNTPLASFRQAVLDYRPRLVWLSASYLPQPEDFLREYRTFYSVCEQAGTVVAIGGRALGEGLRSQMPYTTFGDGLSHLVAFARSQHQSSANRG